MRIFIAASVLALVGFIGVKPAEAQYATRVAASCGTQSLRVGASYPLYMDTTGTLCATGGGGGGGGAVTQGAQASSSTGNTWFFQGVGTSSVPAGGVLSVNVVSGGGTGGTASSFAGTFPATGTAAGFSDGTNMRAGTVINYTGSSYAQAVEVFGVLPAGTNVIGHVINDASSAVIGHVITDTGSTTAVTALPALVAGSAIIGNVRIDQTTPGTTNGVQTLTGSVTTATLAAGSALAGKFGIDQTTVGTTNAISLAQIGATTVANGAGVATGGGVQRIVAAQDTTTIAGSAPGTAGTSSTNVVTVQGIASMTPLLTNPGTASNWGIITQGSTTSGQSGQLAMGAVTTAAPTYTTAQSSPLSLDTSGNLRVTVAGSGSGTSSNFGSAFPTAGTAAGCEYLTSAPTLTTGNMVACQTDVNGNLKTAIAGATFNANGPTNTAGSSPVALPTDQVAIPVLPFARAYVDGGGSATTTGSFTILAASGTGGVKEYLTGLQCGRSDAGTTAITVAVSDGTKTRTFVVPGTGGGSGNNPSLVTPIAFAANTAVTAAFSTGVTTGYCNAEGFYAP
jgi:hypothetical protein